ncbi:hypothetical protein [Micromonospora globbae]|uniref:hypothetical protein n=1 Tax=Micromonospora globbae TaxID=1894969 RepID=UPI00342575A5
MSFRADGTSVVRDSEGGTAGVALAFDPDMARRIADALNETAGPAGGRSRIDPLTGKQVDQLDVNDQTPLAKVLGSGKYVKIVGPYATAVMDTPGGREVRSLAEGAILPGDVTAGHARHLISVDLAKVVEAGSAQEAFEGAPTERHRVEMAHPDVIGPTAGTPAPGSPAADYDRDPIAAARAAAAAGGGRPVTQVTGAGEGRAGDAGGGSPAGDGGETDGGDAKPAGNASRDQWAAYAAKKGAPESETAPVDEGGLSRDALREKYGS